MLDDFTLYWLTNTAISAARFYWELHLNLYNAANVSIPAAVSVFPGENYQAPRSWTERAYNKLIYYNPTRADTMRRGNSRNSFQKRFARASNRCGTAFPNRGDLTTFSNPGPMLAAKLAPPTLCATLVLPCMRVSRTL